MSYAVSVLPTPVFNTPTSPFANQKLDLDPQGRIMAMETIAFPETKFKIIQDHRNNIVEVTTSEYSSSTPLYTDRRFLQPASEMAPERRRYLPSAEAILKMMKSLLGVRYFWGGHLPEGISAMRDLYPHLPEESRDAICQGVDCSGLLYHASNGTTPRNTGDLIHFGKEVEDLKPLDMIVWKGHVIFVLDEDTVIESLIGRGVVLSPLKQRLAEALEIVKTQDKTLFYRRWHPEAFS